MCQAPPSIPSPLLLKIKSWDQPRELVRKQAVRPCPAPTETEPLHSRGSTRVWEMLLTKRCWKGGCCTTYGDENKAVSEKPHYKTVKIFGNHKWFIRGTSYVTELSEWHFRTWPTTFCFPPSQMSLEISPKSLTLFSPLRAGHHSASGFKQEPYQFLQGVERGLLKLAASAGECAWLLTAASPSLRRAPPLSSVARSHRKWLRLRRKRGNTEISRA